MCEKKLLLRRAVIYILVFFLAFTSAFSYANVESNAARKKVTSVKISKKSATIEVGKTKSFTVKVKGSKGVAKRFTAKSSNKKVAKVKVSGKKIKITGVKKGKATITVTTKDKNKKKKKLKAKIKITVKAASTPEVTPTPSAKPTPTPIPKPVIANGIILSSVKLDMKKGEKAKLTAEVKPDNATDKSLEWSSSDAKVASVDKDGNVSALKKGDATITVTNKASGLKATCAVNVKTTATVSSQAELDAILAEGVDELTIDTGYNLTIPAGKYDDCTLFIKGKGVVTNNASFKDVVLADAVEYTENATNNINVQAAATIDIGSKGNAKIAINLPSSDAEKEIKITNSGLVQELDIATAAKVRLEGNAKSDSPVSVNISSEGVALITDHQATVTANAKADLTFKGNTDNTRVTVEDPSQKPDIKGVGFIEVSYKDGSPSEVIAAEPSDEMGKLDITGLIKDASDGKEAGDATVYLIPFNKYQGSATPPEDILDSSTTYSDGLYKFTYITGGNYYMVFKKTGYKPAIQLIAAANKYNSEYVNETMELIPEGITDNYDALLFGTIRDAVKKDSVEGITVELRRNKGNILGEALITTKTDENGEYRFVKGGDFSGLEGDQYTIYVKDERDEEEKYISQNVNICVYPDSTTEKNITISKPVKGNGIRFVLTWAGDAPGVPDDLDAHLFGPSATGLVDYHHVYNNATQYGFGNVIFSSLDVDEWYYNGPETVTIVEPIDGIYHYFVFNFSAIDGYPSYSLLNSEAKVDVYSGNQLLTTFNVPKTGSGYWWYVCSYNSVTGEIESKNQIVTYAQIDGKYVDYNKEIEDFEETNILPEEKGLLSYFKEIKNVDAYTVGGAVYNKETGGINPGHIILHSTASLEETIKKAEYIVKDGYTAEFTKKSGESPDYIGDLVITDASGKVVDYLEVYYYHTIAINVSCPNASRIINNFIISGSITIFTTSPIAVSDIPNIVLTPLESGVTITKIDYDGESDDVDTIYYKYTYNDDVKYFEVFIYDDCFISDIKKSGESVDYLENDCEVSLYYDELPDDRDELLSYTITCADGYTGKVIKKEETISETETEVYYAIQIKKGSTLVDEKEIKIWRN